jgi:hypothetical protein
VNRYVFSLCLKLARVDADLILRRRLFQKLGAKCAKLMLCKKYIQSSLSERLPLYKNRFFVALVSIICQKIPFLQRPPLIRDRFFSAAGVVSDEGDDDHCSIICKLYYYHSGRGISNNLNELNVRFCRFKVLFL